MPKVVDVDRRRAELADAAARLIARSGIESATMREVAAEAGLTTGALTHYFADKRELLLATFRASLEHRRAKRLPDEASEPLDRLLASLDGALPLDDERHRHWMVTLALCSQATSDAVLAEAQRAAYAEFVRYIASLAVASGLVERDGADSFAATLIAAADGIAVQALFDRERWPADRQRATLASMLSSFGIGRTE
ncbi:MAG: TetR/AcrR family transcriptional regulator [Ilumatobacteraceae bacterium]